MARQRDTELYAMHVYVPIHGGADILKTISETKMVSNRSGKTLRPESLSHLAAQFIVDGCRRSGVVPSETAKKWAEEIQKRNIAERRVNDLKTARGEFALQERIATRKRAAVRKAKGLTSRPRPVKNTAAKKGGKN